MRGKKKFSAYVERQIADDYERRSMTYRELAKEYDTSAQVIANIMKRQNGNARVAGPRPALSEQTQELISHAYHMLGLKMGDLATQYKTSVSTISRIISRAKANNL